VARAATDVRFDVSQVVLDEILAGDPDAAERRVALAAGIPVLDIMPEVADLAAALIQRVPLPITAGADAAHIATAAYHRVDFLMTWNSTHIANAEFRPRVERVCRENGHPAPVLCTPDELMGGIDD
jgi:hypothetical protein